MKKIIALLLTLIMTFSVATVAFATEGGVAPEAPEASVPAEGEVDVMGTIEGYLGEYSWILDLPFGVVPPALKIAKIALKLVLVYVKICKVFNLDPMETAKGIFEYIAKIAEENEDLKALLDKIPTTTAPATV